MNYFELVIKFEKIFQRNLGKRLTIRQVEKLFRRAITFDDVVIRFNETQAISSLAGVVVYGEYDPELDRDGEKSISIEVACREFKNSLVLGEDLDAKSWREISIDIASVIGHEYVHMEQFRRRNFKACKGYRSTSKSKNVKFKQEYLGCPDEVGAYAFTAAAGAITSKLQGATPELEKTPIVKIYQKTFGKDSAIVKRLVKQANKCYNILEGQYNETIDRSNSRRANR